MAVRLDLNGLRVSSPAWNQNLVYLIDQGQKRAITGTSTYQRLFRNDSYNPLTRPIIYDMFISEIDNGPDLTNAFLAEPIGGPKIYLVEGGPIKRWITSPEAMDRFYFDWGKILKLPDAFLNSMPDGPNIDA